MMLADLFDEDDFRDSLIKMGVGVSSNMSVLECIAFINENADAEVRLALKVWAQELLMEAGLLQPEVKEALEILCE